jgi:hypothetical protein
VPFGDLDGAVAEQLRDTVERHALQEQRHGKRIAEAMRMTVVNLRVGGDADRTIWRGLEPRAVNVWELLPNEHSHAAAANNLSPFPTASSTFNTLFMITSFPYFGDSILLITSIASP